MVTGGKATAFLVLRDSDYLHESLTHFKGEPMQNIYEFGKRVSGPVNTFIGGLVAG
jgi:hypothetical protein